MVLANLQCHHFHLGVRVRNIVGLKGNAGQFFRGRAGLRADGDTNLGAEVADFMGFLWSWPISSRTEVSSSIRRCGPPSWFTSERYMDDSVRQPCGTIAHR